MRAAQNTIQPSQTKMKREGDGGGGGGGRTRPLSLASTRALTPAAGSDLCNSSCCIGGSRPRPVSKRSLLRPKKNFPSLAASASTVVTNSAAEAGAAAAAAAAAESARLRSLVPLVPWTREDEDDVRFTCKSKTCEGNKSFHKKCLLKHPIDEALPSTQAGGAVAATAFGAAVRNDAGFLPLPPYYLDCVSCRADHRGFALFEGERGGEALFRSWKVCHVADAVVVAVAAAWSGGEPSHVFGFAFG